eukprot:508598_1
MASKDNGESLISAIGLANQISDTTNLLEAELKETLAQPSSSYLSQNDENQYLVPNLPTSQATEVDERAINIASTSVMDIEMQPLHDEDERHLLSRSPRSSQPYHSLDQHELNHEGSDSPITIKCQTILDYEVNTKQIAEVLRHNEVLISDEDLENILKNYASKKDTLIDELCDGYQTRKDQNVPLCKALEDCKILWPDRQIFYDTILKGYVKRRELNNKNFIKILKKTIIYLQLECDLKECERLATSAELKGKLFYKTLKDENDEEKENAEYKSPQQFADVFREMTNVRSQIWMRIYRRINEWKTKNYQKIDWNEIGRILKMYDFKQTEIVHLETKLKKQKIQNKIDENHEIEYEKDQLLKDLCLGVAHDVDDGDEKYAHQESDIILTRVLQDELKCNNQKRRVLYDILLHNYFKNHQLDNINFHLVLTATTREERKSEENWNEKKKHLLSKVEKDGIDGRIVAKGQPQFESAAEFARRFERGQKPKKPKEPDKPLEAIKPDAPEKPKQPLPQPEQSSIVAAHSKEDANKQMNEYNKRLDEYKQTKDEYEKQMEEYRTYPDRMAQYEKDVKEYNHHLEEYHNKMTKYNADNISRRTLAALYREIKTWKTKYQKPEDKQRKEEEEKYDSVQPEKPPVYKPQSHELVQLVTCKTFDLRDLPKYIHKAIWYQSWDENIESLIDCAVVALCNRTKFWNDRAFVEAIYDDHQFYHAVVEVFKDMGKTNFFEEFVNDHYGREIGIWKIELYQANVIDKTELLEKIVKFEFTEFDFNRDHQITRQEFADCISANGIRVDRNYVDQIFDRIDDDGNGFIDLTELQLFAKEVESEITDPRRRIPDEDLPPDVYFKWDERSGTYIIRDIDTDANTMGIPFQKQEGFEWYAYITIPRKSRERFEASHPHEHIKRYWKSVNQIGGQHLSEDELDRIFAVLNHYYTTVTEHNANDKPEGPLHYKNRHRGNCHVSAKFCLKHQNEDHHYELKWWNQKGRYETTAIAIQYKHNPRDGGGPVVYYLRLNVRREELKWRWYDVNSLQYQPMGEYTEDQKNETDYKLIGQLEASFLGNDYQHFHPKQLEEITHDIDLFNSCWLPELYRFLRVRKGLKTGADMFVFSATFSDKSDWKIVSMEQVGYTHREKSAYRRNIERLVNGKNSLLQMSATQDSFVQRWKSLFKLFDEEQQMYFWSFILTIVTQIKYIEIEFENQMVLLPLRKDDGSNNLTQSIISRLIDCNDVHREHLIANNFNGYLIPPLEEWQEGETGENKNNTNEVSKTHTLRRAKLKRKDDDCRWVQEKEDHGSDFQFDRHETQILRMADVIRKFMLEFELKKKSQKKAPLWPWYTNSKYWNNEEGKAKYNKLMGKYNLIYAFDEVLMKYRKDKTARLEQSKKKEEMDESKSSQCVRHKRKFAAVQLLKMDIERNLNYLRHYFNAQIKTRQRMTDTLIQQYLQQLQSEPTINARQKEEEEKEETEQNPKKDRKKRNEKAKWKQLIKKDDLKLKSVTFDKDTFPLFREFMMQCFVERDYKILERNRDMFRYTQTTDFYRIFIDSWRSVPDSFWQYNHDILLMEIVLHKGINSDAIVEYLGKNTKELEERYEFKQDIDNATTVETTTHPLYAFQSWCRNDINVLHRVQHVVKTIIYTLQDSDTSNTALYSIFPSYQKESHLQFIGRDPLDNDRDDFEEQKEAPGEHLLAHNILANYHQNPIEAFKMNMDSYITRDITTELFDSLQAFDLKQYGPIVTRFIIQKLTREPKESHCIVLNRLFYSLPDPVSIEILWKCQDALQRVKPEKLKELCEHIQRGSLFKPSTCLSIAEFFDTLKETDLVQRATWANYEEQFEQNAFEDVAKIENDHMLYMLLNAPLANHEGRCLIQLAQEGSRVQFLNNERISDVIHHMWRRGHLRINETLKPKPKRFSGLMYTLSRYPFRFYLSPQGYHWVGGVLYAEYLLLLFAYAYYWPLQSDPDVKCHVCLDVLEILFWLSNLGYILYEFHEFSQKGMQQYFNLAMMGDANVMDAMIGITWVVLFGTRIGLSIHDDYHEGNGDADADSIGHTHMEMLESGYKFVFGIAILLVTTRSVKILGSSQYFGALILIIKSMFKEMVKFVLLYGLMMLAVLFALRFMGDKDDPSAWNELLYIFQLFISFASINDFDTGDDPDTESFEGNAWTTIYLVIATLFGTLLLFNILVALMVSKYEDAQDQADKDVMLNRTEISFDLLRRSRHMPPPLNIVMYIFTFVVWCGNLIVSVCSYAIPNGSKKSCHCAPCNGSWFYVGVSALSAVIVVVIGGYLSTAATLFRILLIIIFISPWILRVCTSVKLNIFHHIHYGLFDKMRRLNIWKCPSFYLCIGTVMALLLTSVGESFDIVQLLTIRISSVSIFVVLCISAIGIRWYYPNGAYDYKSKYERDRERSQSNRQIHAEAVEQGQQEDKSKKERTPENDHDNPNNLEYFDSLSVCGLIRWYWIEISNALFVIFDMFFLMINVFGLLDMWLKLTGTIGGTFRSDDWYSKPDTSLRMLHKGCYGRIKRFSEDHELNPINGLSMSTYFEKYRSINKHSLPRSDKIMLNKLTAQTLFCPHCYQPFLNTDPMIEKQLASPLNALFDLMSAVVFVAVPIAWIPLLIVMFVGVVMDTIAKLFDMSDRVNENYSNRDYDRNYFPDKIISHQNDETVKDQVSKLSNDED